MRIRFITKNPLQTKYLVLILISILVPLFIVGGCLYYLIFQIMAEQLAIPEAIAYNLFPVVERINFLLIVGVPPIVILLFIWGAVLSHRLIGPLERLENDLRKISDGDYSMRLKIRKDDDLRPIADAINKIIDKLEKK
ncbi:MAG: HAMP domain-containing protein [Candidatus Omnitrophota bacterium]